MADLGKQPTGLVTDPRAPRTIARESRVVSPGAVLAERYEIREQLGAGGMGTVWRAHDRTLGVDIALKVLSADLIADAASLDRFRREVKVARSISHPNVCRVFDVGEADGLHFLTMALLSGRSLRALLSEGPLEPERALLLFGQIVDGVAAAHGEGILHRDLKPENVVVQPDGRAVVVDFGLARAPYGAGGASSTVVAGTPAYMSPEQLRGEPLDLRSDVFACGLVGYEMLTGRSPFGDGTPASVITAILRDAPAPLSRLSMAPRVESAVAAILERALAKNRDDRFASAAELAAALRDAATGRRPAGGAPRTNRTRAVVVGALAICAAGIVWWMSTRSPDLSARGTAVEARTTTPAPTTPLLRIALVRNLTGDATHDATASSMRETLRAAAQTIAGLRVETGHGEGESQAAFRLVGTVQRVSERLRLTAQLSGSEGAEAPVEVDTDAASLTRALESLRERVRVEVRLLLRAHLRHVRAEAGTKDAAARARMLAYYRMIGAAPKTEHLDAGERLLTEALAADASYGPALVERAYLRLVRASSQRAPEALKGALDDLGRAIAIAPRDPSARVMRCRAFQFAVEFRGAPTDTSLEEASRECGLALELDPDSVPVRLVLARLHDRRCEDDPAMETLERALEVDRAYEGRILEHLVGLAMQNERLPLADTLSARLLAYEAEERRLGPRSPSRRAGVPSSSHAALVRGGILLRLRKLDDARRVLRAQLERSAAGLGDKAVEAASIRGLLRAGSREASLERRLRELEGEFDVARRAQPAIALRVASFYSWTDPVAAARWLDRLATPGGCTEAINRALLYAGTGQARGARAALASCTPTQSWEKRCAAFVERRIQR